MSCSAQVWEGYVNAPGPCNKPTKEGARYCCECAQRKLIEANAQFYQAELARNAASKEIALLYKELSLP